MTELEISYNILERLGINAHKVKAKGWTTVHCPLHEDKNPSCGICINDEGRGTYNCFSCGAKGTLRQLYRDITGVSINKDLGIPWESQDQCEVSALERLFKPKNYTEEDLTKTPNVNIGMKGILVPIEDSEATKSYLENRHISLKVANNMKMKYAVKAYTYSLENPEDKTQFMNFSKRLVIPIFENGKILSYEGRDIFGKEAWELKQKKENTNFLYKKCIYPKGASTNTLFQLDKLRKDENIFFVEGLMDLAVLREDCFFNEKNSTTIFGANITNRQFELLTSFESFTYIIDNDAAGWRSLKHLKDKLIESKKVGNYKFITPPFEDLGVKDVGDLPTKAQKTVSQCRNMKWLNNTKNVFAYSDYIDHQALLMDNINKAKHRIIIG